MRIVLLTAAIAVGFLFTVVFIIEQSVLISFRHQIDPLIAFGGSNQTNFQSHRKLLGQNTKEPNRVWGDKCSKSDIVVNQGPTSPLPNGIPTYTVEIMNVCASGCDISNIHLSCGWFSSARLINPMVFKRVRFDDCIVNDGPMYQAGTLSGNPLAMTAGIHTLKRLKESGSYQYLDKITEELIQGILDAGKREGHEMCSGYINGKFGFFFTGGPVYSFEDAKKSDTAKFARFHRGMLEEGLLASHILLKISRGQ